MIKFWHVGILYISYFLSFVIQENCVMADCIKPDYKSGK